jgi:hypothetical protein
MPYLGIQYSGLLALHLNYEFGFHVSFPKNQTETNISINRAQFLGQTTVGQSTDRTRFWTTLLVFKTIFYPLKALLRGQCKIPIIISQIITGSWPWSLSFCRSMVTIRTCVYLHHLPYLNVWKLCTLPTAFIYVFLLYKKQQFWTWEAQGYTSTFVVFEIMHNFLYNMKLFQVQMVLSPHTVTV